MPHNQCYGYNLKNAAFGNAPAAYKVDYDVD